MPMARVSIALVDSDMDIRRAVQLRLQAGPFDVRAYASGLAMLSEMARQVDCMIVRAEMVEIDGFELLYRLRARGWHGPAILMTNAASPALAAKATEAGFATVIDRPLVDDRMLHAVDEAIRAPTMTVA